MYLYRALLLAFTNALRYSTHSVLSATKYEPYLPKIASHCASLPFAGYSASTEKEMAFDLYDWLHTQINFSLRELNPDMVTHPSTNQV